MRIARFAHNDEPAFGLIEDETVHILTGDPLYGGINPNGQKLELADVRLLAPVIPRSKVIAVGRNYEGHIKEMDSERPTSPLLFFKPNTSVVGPNDPVSAPSFSDEISYEAELAVVISRIAKEVPEDRVNEVIFGYTCANDLTARDVQRTDNQWARAKGFDGACPIGPWIETELDPTSLSIQGYLEGELKQDGNTEQMIFAIPELISYISQAFTLLPGDIILTGTPAGVGTITDGQEYRVDIEGIGELATTLRA